ncbi:MAG TPA: glycosyltransferase family 9 protein [Opitutaceae bacterium]|nr:glycosyltransferase family 9 protein [Opitutaceae bacterium]
MTAPAPYCGGRANADAGSAAACREETSRLALGVAPAAPKRQTRSSTGNAKALAWRLCGAMVVLARLGANVLGKRKDVDVLVYKVDRLGDWLLAEPTLERILSAAKLQSATVAFWVADESALLRRWRQPGCTVESFALEPEGTVKKIKRAWKIVGLLATYRARSFICLRHAPEPIRDFVLGAVDAGEIRALSWVIRGDSPQEVPHEILRHCAILDGMGIAPPNSRDLLPNLAGRDRVRDGVAVIAPFSSGSIKDWSDESWIKVANELAIRGFQMELWVGPLQVARASELAGKMIGNNLATRVAVKSGSLRELAGAIATARLVLSVDTFAAHVAAAMDAPLVSLIGGGQFGDFGPWRRSSRQRWVSNRISCFGCDWRCVRPRVDCMLDILPSEVVAQADEALLCDAETGTNAAASN